VVARLAQVFDPRLKVGDDYFEIMAISAFRFSLAGGDGMGVIDRRAKLPSQSSAARSRWAMP
jgi:hypothetical protein